MIEVALEVVTLRLFLLLRPRSARGPLGGLDLLLGLCGLLVCALRLLPLPLESPEPRLGLPGELPLTLEVEHLEWAKLIRFTHFYTKSAPTDPPHAPSALLNAPPKPAHYLPLPTQSLENFPHRRLSEPVQPLYSRIR